MGQMSVTLLGLIGFKEYYIYEYFNQGLFVEMRVNLTPISGQFVRTRQKTLLIWFSCLELLPRRKPLIEIRTPDGLSRTANLLVQDGPDDQFSRPFTIFSIIRGLISNFHRSFNCSVDWSKFIILK